MTVASHKEELLWRQELNALEEAQELASDAPYASIPWPASCGLTITYSQELQTKFNCRLSFFKSLRGFMGRVVV